MISLVTLTLFDILLLGYLYSLWPGIANQKIRHPEYVYTGKVTAIWIVCTVFCVFAGWDTDYMHYYSIYRKIYENELSILMSHIELAYYPFISFSFGSYSLFRFYIWGLAIFLLVTSLKRLGLNNNMSAILFVLFNLLYFSYARASLAILIYIYGLILVRQREAFWPMLSTFFGVVLMLASIFFHKSMFFLILATPLAYIRFTKIKVIFLILLLPVIVYIIYYAKDIIIADAGGDTDDLFKISSSASTYTSQSSYSEGPVGMFISFLEMSALIYGFCLSWIKRKILASDSVIKGLWNITIGLITISILSSLMGFGHVISRRVILLAYICLYFVLAYIFTIRFSKKSFVTFSLLAFSYSAVKIIYYLYVNKVYDN